jgi:hypothetical protein
MKINIGSSALLVEVSVSSWSARKLDKKVTEEVNVNKGASRSASRTNKNLLADDEKLEAINKYAANFRNWLYSETLPWSNSGLRLIPTAKFFDFKTTLDKYKAEFEGLVSDFVTDYPTRIAAQAFKLGSMFNRDEYPNQDDIAHKFRFSYCFSPVPEAGHFLVDLGEEMEKELRDEYEKAYEERVNSAMKDLWTRLKDSLDKIAERLTPDEGGKNKIFRDSLVDNVLDLCGMLRDLNVTNDVNLEKARREVEMLLSGVVADDLRKSEEIRKDVKSEVDAILGKFAW